MGNSYSFWLRTFILRKHEGGGKQPHGAYEKVLNINCMYRTQREVLLSQSCFVDEVAHQTHFTPTHVMTQRRSQMPWIQGDLCATTCTFFKILEDGEERTDCQTGCCSSEHAQSHVPSVIALTLLNNNVVHSRRRVPTYKTATWCFIYICNCYISLFSNQWY